MGVNPLSAPLPPLLAAGGDWDKQVQARFYQRKQVR